MIRRRWPAAVLSAALLFAACPAAAAPVTPSAPPMAAPSRLPEWGWPVRAPRVVAPFVQPAHAYAAGHRGIDLSGDGDAVTAPANGVVAFVGTVVDRGVLTIDHGGGWVSSFEPVTSPLLPGAIVVRGQEVARLAAGGHATLGTLHLGVRYEGEYVNPLLLLGGVPRAVLLPCC